MSKSVLITKSGPLFNDHVITDLLEQGCAVSLIVTESGEAESYRDRLPERSRDRFYPIDGGSENEADIREAVDQAVRQMDGLHVLIHGVEAWDEEGAYDKGPSEFGRQSTDALRLRFLYSRAAAAHMARKKTGHLLFLLLADSLYYEGYPSSPVLNYGTLAMMRTLAKELSPFRVAVNAVTYGYYADPEGQMDKKQLKQRLEIHALKPYVPQPQEMVTASLAWLLAAPEAFISGQNLHIGAGMDTVV